MLDFKGKYHFLTVISIITLLVFSGACLAYAEEEEPEGPAAPDPVYVMKVDGEEVLTLKTEESGQAALEKVAKALLPDGVSLDSFTVDENIEYEEITPGPLFAAGNALKSNDASEILLDKMQEEQEDGDSDNEFLTFHIVGSKYKYKTTPVKVKFVYKDDMFDFEFDVRKKGTKGKTRTRYELTFTNEKKESKEEKETETVKKGKKTVIYTGKKKNPKNMSASKFKSYKAKIQKSAVKRYGNIYLGMNIVAFGKKFLGNPYRVGGKSLTHGIDCVQFVRALYKHFGITLPENRHKLYRTGKVVSYKNARPGDVVFYGKHPAIYMGHGKIISARKSGIRISNIGYKKWTYIRRMR